VCNKPRVSIGLPVFNGEKYLEEALNSILGQTYPDFELIISDNASTDRTQQICRSYAAKDSRVRYYRNKRNLGASKNFNSVFFLSLGEYFKWAAYDDVLAPEFLEKCINILDHDPSIVLCYSKTGSIDEHGALVGARDYKIRINSRKPHVRFGDLISIRYPCAHAIFGVIRASKLNITPLMGNYIGSDRNLLAEIGLIGRIHKIPECLLFRRKHPQTYTNLSPWWDSNVQTLSSWWYPTKTQRIIFSYNFLEYLRSVKRIPLKWSERLLCYAQIGKWFVREGWILLGTDMEVSLLRRLNFGRKLASAVKIPGRKLYKRLGGVK
jgi:glycosyltransferase involved in cell wall biosynthesis